MHQWWRGRRKMRLLLRIVVMQACLLPQMRLLPRMMTQLSVLFFLPCHQRNPQTAHRIQVKKNHNQFNFSEVTKMRSFFPPSFLSEMGNAGFLTSCFFVLLLLGQFLRMRSWKSRRLLLLLLILLRRRAATMAAPPLWFHQTLLLSLFSRFLLLKRQRILLLSKFQLFQRPKFLLFSRFQHFQWLRQVSSSSLLFLVLKKDAFFICENAKYYWHTAGLFSYTFETYSRTHLRFWAQILDVHGVVAKCGLWRLVFGHTFLMSCLSQRKAQRSPSCCSVLFWTTFFCFHPVPCSPFLRGEQCSIIIPWP